MAAMAEPGAEEDKRLQDIFLDGWKGFEELEETSLPFNSTELQNKLKSSMKQFETATRIVSEVGMFSANELLDEVSTESLRYLLLPYFLGKLALKLHNNQQNRSDVLNVAEIYFNDYLQRCAEYELTNAPKSETQVEKAHPEQNADEMKELLRAAQNRNDKIAKYRQKKELDEHIKLMRVAVQNDTVDDEVKREFFLKFLKKAIIDANEELDSLKLEQQMLEMRKMHMSTASSNDAANGHGQENSSHAHGQQHHHHHHHAHGPPKPKPLQPFIITRNAAQKAVFGLGYPSLPVMTVNEFYQQRVDEGIFPDEEKVAKMNAAQAIAAAQDPNEKEDQEQAVVEVQIENDDPEYLARMRRMDEYKDVVRRGDGNRHNRS